MPSSDENLETTLKTPLPEPSEPVVSDPYLGTLLNNRYRIEKEIGRGGLGVVYLAQDKHLLSKQVVVKVLLEESVQNEWAQTKFRQEIEALTRIDHPGVVGVLDAGEMPDGKPFLVMQYVEGKTLRNWIRPGGSSQEMTGYLMRQIGQALSAAHDKGVFHRDLKPDNIMLQNLGTSEQQIKVIDFGIARVENSELANDTSSEFLAGTIAYMSPEQLRGQPVTSACDIFSMGVIAYEMVTGKRPFDGRTAVMLYKQHYAGQIVKPSDLVAGLPETVDAVVLKALDYRPEKRYGRARDFGEELWRALTGKITVGELSESAENEVTLVPESLAERSEPILRRKTSGERIVRETEAIRPARANPLRNPFLMVGLGGLLALLLGWAGYRFFLSPKTAPTSEVRNLAILPFRNLKPDAQTDFLGFSLADAVIAKLGYVRNLVVRPSSYVEKYRSQPFDPQQIARELNVDTLLTGSFLKEGDDLRITAQLIDLRTNGVLWQDTIDLKYDRLLTVQDRVSREIIAGLQLNLTPDESKRLALEAPRNATAYEYFLRGIDLYVSNDYRMAAKMFEESVRLDPDYAVAWAHLGRAYNAGASKHFGGREDYDKAMRAYERALALNPEQIETRVFMANSFTDTNRVEQAVPILRELLKIAPNHAEAHWELGYAYRYAGMLSDSVSECELARRIDPSVKITSSAFNSYLYNGQYDKFLAVLPQRRDSAFILFYRGFGLYYQGDKHRAQTSFDDGYAQDPQMLQAQIGKALSYSIAGETNKGVELMRTATKQIEERDVLDAEAVYKVAQAFAELGEKGEALRLLRRAVEGGFFCYPYFLRDPLLNGVRDQAEFRDILDIARKRHEAFKQKFFGESN